MAMTMSVNATITQYREELTRLWRLLELKEKHNLELEHDLGEAANTIEAQALDLIRVTDELAKSGGKVISLEMWNNQAAEKIKALHDKIAEQACELMDLYAVVEAYKFGDPDDTNDAIKKWENTVKKP